MSLIRVNNIYPAFMGEINQFGIGAKCTFLRLAGCNIRCYKKTMGMLCDTPESLEGTDGELMSLDDIITELKQLDNKLICLTGGEPLMFRPLPLLERLSFEGFNVVVETNGTIDISIYRHFANVDFIVDYKAKSTGEEGKFRERNFNFMRKTDYLKFVIYDEDDYQQMKHLYHTLEDKGINFSAGLFWGSKMGYLELMDKIIKDKLNVHLNMQTHKMAVMYDHYREDAQKLFIPRSL